MTGKGISVLRALCLVMLGFAPVCAQAQQVSVSAGVSDSVAQVGRPFRYEIRVEGAMRALVPRSIDVDGARITYAGQQTQFQMHNFQMRSSVSYLYTVLPMREGRLLIPSVTIDIDGKKYKTNAVEVDVAQGSVPRAIPVPPSQPQQQLPQPQPGIQAPLPPPGRIAQQSQQQPQPTATPSGRRSVAFAELKVSKTDLYVGEVLPVEIRFYFDARIPFQPEGMPSFGGEGFTSQKLDKPQQGRQNIDGIPYNVVTFYSSITPVKAGTLEVPPATLSVMAQLPGSSQLDDFFQQFFGGGPLPGFGNMEELVIESNPLTLQVQALPKEGRPESFTGAVGEFTMTSEVTPKKIGPNDPATLKFVISGEGNFDAVEAPKLTDDEGWRTYPPKAHFEPQDQIGYAGRKTFESLILARQSQKMTPGGEFSYFDPKKKKYVTLTTPPIPIEASGSSQQSDDESSAPSTSNETTAASPTPVPEKPEPQESPVFETLSGRGETFVPLTWRREFLWINVGAGVLLVLVFAGLFIRTWQRGERGRLSRLRGRARRKLATLSSGTSDRAEFYKGAVELLRMSLKDSSSGFTGASEVVSSRSIDEQTAAEIRRIFDSYDELQFSRRAAGQKTLDPVEKERTLNTLRKFLEADHV